MYKRICNSAPPTCHACVHSVAMCGWLLSFPPTQQSLVPKFTLLLSVYILIFEIWTFYLVRISIAHRYLWLITKVQIAQPLEVWLWEPVVEVQFPPYPPAEAAPFHKHNRWHCGKWMFLQIWLHSDYIPTTFQLHSDYILTTFWPHSDIILTIFWQHSDCLLTTF